MPLWERPTRISPAATRLPSDRESSLPELVVVRDDEIGARAAVRLEVDSRRVGSGATAKPAYNSRTRGVSAFVSSRYTPRSAASRIAAADLETGLVHAIDRLLLGVPLVHQLLDESGAGERAGVEVAFSSPGSLFVPVGADGIHAVGGVRG